MKRYTEPKKQHLYNKTQSAAKIVTRSTIAGTAISSLLTIIGVYLYFSELPQVIRVSMALLSPIVIEGLTHVVSSLLPDFVFSAIKKKDRKINVILSFVCGVCLLFVGGLNVFVSTNASKQTVTYAIGEAKQEAPTYEAYNMLLNKSLNMFAADSLRIVSQTNSLKNSIKDSLNNVVSKTNNRLTELQTGYKQTPWFNKQIQTAKQKRARARQELKGLSSKITQIKNDSINKASSRKLELLAVADGSKYKEIKTVEAKNETLLSKHNQNKSTWSTFAVLIALIGVFSALIKYTFLHGRNYICGVERIYNTTGNELNESLLLRFWIALKMRVRNFFEKNVIEKIEITPTVTDDIDTFVDVSEMPSNIVSIGQQYEQKKISNLIELTKRQYKRRITSATEAARVKNESKYKENAKELRRLGYYITPDKTDNTKLSITQKVRKAL